MLAHLKKETCQRKAQVHAIEPTAPTLGGRRPVVMPDPHSTIQEEEPESKPTFVKQVSTLSVFFLSGSVRQPNPL